MSKKDVVFTTVMGDYESMNELQLQSLGNCRYVCFTDSPKLTSSTWEIIRVEPFVPGDSVRSSRRIKMLGYQYFPSGTRSLYIDNSVKLGVPGDLVLDEWLVSGPVSFMHHSTRKTVRDEFFICSAYGLEVQEVLWKHFQYYKKNIPKVLIQQPHWGGMIARINDPMVDRLMLEWARQYERFSKRDQLSLNASSIVSGVPIHAIEGRNDIAPWHTWPITSNRKNETRSTIGDTKFRKVRIILNGLRFGARFYLP